MNNFIFHIDYVESFNEDDVLRILGAVTYRVYAKLVALIFTIPANQVAAIQTLKAIIKEAERIDNAVDVPEIDDSTSYDLEAYRDRIQIAQSHAVKVSRRYAIVLDMLDCLLESIHTCCTLEELSNTAERWIVFLRKNDPERFNQHG